MKILVSGSTGFIGTRVVASLTAQGHDVHRLVRPQSSERGIVWDPQAGTIDAAQLEGFDAVIHLAGENLGTHRWTAAVKARIRRSRIDGTALLATTLAGLARPPRVLLSASAVGFYGDRGDEALDEASLVGSGFMAQLCRDWEAACAPAAARGIRVAFLRMGVILAGEYGALAALAPAHRFGFGFGAVLGSGRQHTPWVSVRDVLRAVDLLLVDDALQGPVNVVAPQVVPQATFARTLSQVFGRTARLRLPAALLRLARGEVVDPLLLDSIHVQPRRLLEHGFRFAEPELRTALCTALALPAAREELPASLVPVRYRLRHPDDGPRGAPLPGRQPGRGGGPLI